MINTVEGHLSAAGLSIGIVASRFNNLVTTQLLNGAVDCLVRHGASEKDITVVHCPGAFEIPQIALQMASSGKYDAIICLGCVIRGETPHFDFIAAEVAKGTSHVALHTGVPTVFGVLTTDNLSQALERAGGKSGNKGWEAGLTAIELTHITIKLSEGKKRSKH